MCFRLGTVNRGDLYGGNRSGDVHQNQENKEVVLRFQEVLSSVYTGTGSEIETGLWYEEGVFILHPGR